MKIRRFASQNATHFRVFANQFDNFVQIISTRERQGHIYQRAMPAVGLYSSQKKVMLTLTLKS